MPYPVRVFVGILCLIVGLFALVTPFTPGAWLLLVGMELLGLSFLLPRPVRTRWESFKSIGMEKLRGLLRRK